MSLLPQTKICWRRQGFGQYGSASFSNIGAVDFILRQVLRFKAHKNHREAHLSLEISHTEIGSDEPTGGCTEKNENGHYLAVAPDLFLSKDRRSINPVQRWPCGHLRQQLSFGGCVSRPSLCRFVLALHLVRGDLIHFGCWCHCFRCRYAHHHYGCRRSGRRHECLAQVDLRRYSLRPVLS